MRKNPGEGRQRRSASLEFRSRDLAKGLLSLHPSMKTLFMSGYTADFISHHGVLDERMHFMQKPFTTSQLALKVAEVLGREERQPPKSADAAG